MTQTPITDLIAELAAAGVPVETIIITVRAFERKSVEVPKLSMDSQAGELDRRREKDRLRKRLEREEAKTEKVNVSKDNSSDGPAVLLEKKSLHTSKEKPPSLTPSLFSGEVVVSLDTARARPDDLAAAMQAYNVIAAAKGLPICKALNKDRARSLRLRLAECGGLTGWQDAMGKLALSPFLTGQNPKGWRAGFDFLLQSSSFQKLIEGSYDDRTPVQAPGKTGNLAVFDELIADAKAGNGQASCDAEGGFAPEHDGPAFDLDAERDYRRS